MVFQAIRLMITNCMLSILVVFGAFQSARLACFVSLEVTLKARVGSEKSRLCSHWVCFPKLPTTLTQLACPLISGWSQIRSEWKRGLLVFWLRVFVCLNDLRRDVEALIRADPSPLQCCVCLITGEMGLSNTWSIPASDLSLSPSPSDTQTRTPPNTITTTTTTTHLSSSN